VGELIYYNIKDVKNIQELKLISPISPSVNHYLGWRAILKNGKPMTMSYKKPEAIKYQKDFANYVKKEAKKQGWVKSNNKFQHYYMDCIFYFDRVDKDANNSFKCLADAITDSEAVWIDDTQLCERVQGIYYDSENPRIEITIHEVEYIGVFNNASQLEEFESNCIGCKRYKRNCSLLKKAIEGKIQANIHDNKCDNFSPIK
jgi:crossover junction endodeoxyribonuclease RusA